MAKTKTLSKLKGDVQKVFNAYIRQRDEGKPCISCGKVTKLQAGHYYPVSTHQGLRYNEDNVHGECARCNCFDEGHLINYRENLIERIGMGRFGALEVSAKLYKMHGYKFTRPELLEIKQKYLSLLR